MSVTDKVKFKAFLTDVGTLQGQRCKGAKTNENGDIVAAALTISLLIGLRQASHAKLLSHHDIQVVIDSFAKAAKVKEVEHPMGGVVFERVE